MVCTACGRPADRNASGGSSDDEGRTATDINYIGGGTQAPETEEGTSEYRSPTLSSAPPPTSLTWASSIDQAVRLAQRDERKRVIAYFYSENCADCRTIERDVFANPDVIAASRNWVFVKVDSEKNPELSEYYMTSSGSPPAFCFVDKMGHTYRRYFGLVTPEEFVTMLRTWR